MTRSGAVVLAAILATPAFFARAAEPAKPETQKALARKPPAQRSLERFSSSVRRLTRRVSPAIAEIEVTAYGPSTDDGGNATYDLSLQRSSGSGIIVDPSGYIMTNAHVIRHATALRVVLGAANDGTRAAAIASAPARAFTGHVVGVDQEADLALVKIDATGLPTIQFGNSDAVAQGDVVLAIGSPMLLRNSLSVGVVSATARAIGDDDPVLYIQTDASLNPGESGGALIDTAGRVVGLSTSILSKSGGDEGIGFAIPSNLVRIDYQQLRARGKVFRTSLGIRVQDITPTLARALSLPVQHGVMVTDFDPATSPSTAGLQRKDVVLELNGSPVRSVRQFSELVDRRNAGENVRLTLQRGPETFIASIAATASSPPADPLAMTGTLQQNLISRLGIFCVEITKQVADALPDLRTQYGLVVVARTLDGPAAFIDIKEGDVIHKLNDLPISSLDAFRQRIAEFHAGDAAALQIERHGHILYTAFEIQ